MGAAFVRSCAPPKGTRDRGEGRCVAVAPLGRAVLGGTDLLPPLRPREERVTVHPGPALPLRGRAGAWSPTSWTTVLDVVRLGPADDATEVTVSHKGRPPPWWSGLSGRGSAAVPSCGGRPAALGGRPRTAGQRGGAHVPPGGSTRRTDCAAVPPHGTAPVTGECQCCGPSTPHLPGSPRWMFRSSAVSGSDVRLCRRCGDERLSSP